MGIEPSTAWAIATHMAELVAAHGLVEAGKAPLKLAARKAAVWLREHLPAEDQPKLAAVEQNSVPGPARAALELATNALLEARPELLVELRALLAEAHAEDNSQRQTVGDNSRAVQNRGDHNTISISG